MLPYLQNYRHQLGALLLALLLMLPTAGYAADTSSPGTDTSFLERVVDAIRDWLSSFSSGSDDSDVADSTSPAEEAPTTAGSTLVASDTGTAGPVNPDALAQAIARDSGGHADQYDTYSERLAMTLSKLTPKQRGRVLGN